jgi:FAD/FMN-containing dehydrogenase
MSTTFSTKRSAVRKRRARVDGHLGQVVFPGDIGWDEARQAWNVFVDQRPAAVLFPEDADDVAAAVRYAREAGLRVAVQGTGHMASPLGDLSKTALIRTTRMQGVEIDGAARRARVEAGVIWDDVVKPATELGLTALHGSSPDVGVMGYSLGGGIGWLARLYGLATNSITAIELVTADGEQLRVDESHDSELFWGLRGGVANFGVVTAVELELFPLEQVYAGWLIWDWERSHDVLNRWVEWTETTPDTVTSAGRILRLPPLDFIPEPIRGRDIVVVEAAYVGSEESGVELLRPLRELKPELDTFGVVPAYALARLHQDPEGPTPAIGNGGLLDELPPAAVDAYVAAAGPGSGSPLVSSEFRQLGGALGRPAPGGGALSRLEGSFATFSVGLPMDAESAHAIERHVHVVNDSLAPWRSGRMYTNFAEQAEDVRSIFPAETYERLRALKRRLDPSGLFHASQQIPAVDHAAG